MNNDIIIKVYKRAIVISFFIMGFSFFIFKNPKQIVLGYLFGLIISMLSFKLMDSTIKNAIKMKPGRASSYTVFHYMVRYFIYFIVLAAAAIGDYLNFPATLLGLLMVKLTITASTFVGENFTK